MDRSPPGPGPGGDNPAFPLGRRTGDRDRPRSPGQSSFPGTGDQRTEHFGEFGPRPTGSPRSTEPGYTPGDQADPMPTVPIPRLPDAGSRYPATPAPAFPGSVPDPYHRSPATADPEHLPPATTEPQDPRTEPARYPAPTPDNGAPGGFPSSATGPPSNAGYEGDWADWMVSSDGYPPRPGGETANPYPAEARSASCNDGAPVDDVRATESRGGSVEVPPDPNAGTLPATARERLRARLTPREVPAPIPAPARTTSSPGRNRLLPALLGVAGVAALRTAAYVQFAVVGAGEPASAPRAANPPASPAQDVPPAADPNCPAERTGNTVQGNGPGGTGSGTDAIFGFQHAYYATRSGEQARTVVVPDAAVPSAADIQHGIDTIPAGTTHCIQITPGAFVGQYTVVVTEHRPGSAPLGYNPQLVTTMRIGDRTLITGIGPMP